VQAANGVRNRILVAILLIAGPFFLALGLTLPLVRFEKLYFFSVTPSLIAIVASLWSEGDRLLAALVAAFSILFPVVKLLAIAAEAVNGGGARDRGGFVYRMVPLMSKWSMMDVLLVALVIVAAKTSGIASALTQPGLWFYAASTLAVTICHALLQVSSSRDERGSHPDSRKTEL